MDASNSENPQSDQSGDHLEGRVVQAQYATDTTINEFRFPPRVIVEQQGLTLRRILLVLLLAALGISVLFNFGLLAQYQNT